jgi:DNA gyrase subunit A
MGRATQGVTLISLDDGTQLSGVQRVVESDADDVVEGEIVEGAAPVADSVTEAPPATE